MKRLLILSVCFAVMWSHAIAAECPLGLPLTSDPDAYMAQLKKLPEVKSQRVPERPPLFGHCTYQVSTFMQMGMPPQGLCSIEGQPATMTMAEILDSRPAVVAQAYLVLKTDQSLPAIKSALSKIGTAVSREREPKALTTVDSKHWVIDLVYGNGDDLWTVGHQQLEPGETRAGPDIYIVKHVRREWLDFSNRDLNTCTEFPQ